MTIGRGQESFTNSKSNGGKCILHKRVDYILTNFRFTKQTL